MKWLGRFSHILEQFTNSEKEHPEILNEHNKHILSVFIKNYGHRTLSNNFRIEVTKTQEWEDIVKKL